MKLVIVAVYDNAVKAFMTPFFARSRGEAIRMFVDACADVKSPFHLHAEDYVAYFVGEFVDSDAAISAPSSPERLMSAMDAVAGT